MEQPISHARLPSPRRVDEAESRITALEEAVRARDAFLAIAAHELRNPMYALSLHLQLALRRAERTGDDDLVKALTAASRALNRYVERATVLLDVSRLNAGHVRSKPQDMDFTAVIRQVVERHAAEAAFAGVAVSLDLPDALPGYWDALAVEQIVGNLLSNAIKFGAGRPVEVRLVRDGSDACLSVRDHGPGIAPEEQERIFGRFEQVVPAATCAPGRPGFGVGLWLVRSLLDAHGGSIAIDSRPGAGATFRVRMPVNATPIGQPAP